jgi:predicted nucleotidyltransferase
MLKDVLAQFPTLVLVFGSVAQGRASAGSDLDIAVAAGKPLTVFEQADFMPYRNRVLAERRAVKSPRFTSHLSVVPPDSDLSIHTKQTPTRRCRCNRQSG